MKAITAFLAVALISTASARFGETEAEFKKRYGEPVMVNNWPVYTKNGLKIKGHFGKDGKCDCIEIHSPAAPFTKDEAAYLVLVNAGKIEIKVVDHEDKEPSGWQAEDPEVFTAWLQDDKKRLFIFNKAGAEWNATPDPEKGKKAPKAVEGF